MFPLRVLMRGAKFETSGGEPMANLMLRDNFFDDLFDLRRDFDQIFNRVFSNRPGLSRRELPEALSTLVPPVNASVDKDAKKFVVQIALPGVDPKDVNIQAQGNVLHVSGERKATTEKKEADYYQREIVYGSFERTIPLPDGVESDNLNAEYRNGVLEITAPISAAALPRRIEIKSAPENKQAASAGR
jgi:HSP20 family protein